MSRAIAAAVVVVISGVAFGQGRGVSAGPPPSGRAAAPIDLAGYWVSLIVDEWRFRVSPQKGDLAYLPLNSDARQSANAWDPDKDTADNNQCRAYGAVGLMQRPGRLHIIWENDDTLRIDADAGTQTRHVHFGAAQADRSQPSRQGYSTGEWQVPRGAALDLGGIGFVAGLGSGQRANRTGTLKIFTTNMLPGYLRKNGVPYSSSASLTEYVNRLTGANGEAYIALTSMLEDARYLTQPFVRTYTFKQQPDASGWAPTECLPR